MIGEKAINLQVIVSRNVIIGPEAQELLIQQLHAFLI